MRKAKKVAIEESIEVARRVLAKELTPASGASKIWVISNAADRQGVARLRVFEGLASEWEDSPEHRPALAQDICDECRSLVAQEKDFLQDPES